MPTPASRKVKSSKLGLWPLVFSIFFCVSGGPYGLESTLGEAGPSIGLLLIVVTPLIWALPAALISAELGSAIPEQGGFITWVDRAFGAKAAFLCGWWTWVYAWVDAAIYPVLFAGYTEALLSLLGHPITFSPLTRWLVGLLIIVPSTVMNILGIRHSGRAALLLATVVLLPFVWLSLSGPFVPLQSLPKPSFASAGLAGALFAAMWNYLGWDTVSTVAAETDEPAKSYPRALALAMGLIVLCYLVPVLVALNVAPLALDWTENSWPRLAALVGGKSLGVVVAGCALASSAGQFNSMLMTTSRIPEALAARGMLPTSLSSRDNRWQTPLRAILVSAAFYTVLSFQSFGTLAVADVVLYSAALILEFFALAKLRRTEPDLHRPFRVPGGWLGVGLVVAMPVALCGLALYLHLLDSIKEVGFGSLLIIGVALFSGPVAFQFFGRRTV